MNQKVFMQKIDEMLKGMSEEELRNCLHNIARKTSEAKREPFIQMLEDNFNQNSTKGNKKKIQYKRLMTDEKVIEKLCDVKRVFNEIENADLCISAEGYEDYSSGYWNSDWIWEYDDNDGIGSIIEDAVLFAHDCMNDCRYEEAVTVFDLVLKTPITVEDEYGGDSFELSLDEMVDENLTTINLKTLALDVLYSNYQLHTPNQRASALYSYFIYPYFKDIHIEDMFSIGREELTGIDEFFKSWIDFLMQQSSEVAVRLLKEGLLYYKGTDGLLEMARKGFKEHPSLYYTALLEFEKNHDYNKMKVVGKEAIDNLDHDLRIRGEIAIKTAQAACCANDIELMRKCWYEAFVSNTTVPNFLRLFVDKEVLKEYKSIAENCIEKLCITENYYNRYNSETSKNDVDDLEYKHLHFFSGHFDKVINWCMEQKNPLGWSGKFIGYGVDLMLLYLHPNRILSKAGKLIAARVASRVGFNESKNLVFFTDNSVFEADINLKNGIEIFWYILNIWKENYKKSDDDIKSHIEWLESVIDKRIEGIVGGKYRNKYGDVALLAALLGEVKESLGGKDKKKDFLNKYFNKYSRYSAFRGALREYMD